jgi:hypothetical protein
MPKNKTLPNWTDFERAHRFEETVLDLTRRSIEILSASPLGKETFTAFAFNCVSGEGSISLSFDTQKGIRVKNLYPPDWRYECMEYEVREIAELWKTGYARITAGFKQAEKLFGTNYQALDAFGSGYLNSLRKVMVRLEKEKAFHPLRTSKDFWTLVTRIDADTDEEEGLLQRMRDAG